MRPIICTLALLASLAVTGFADGQGLAVTGLSPAARIVTAPVDAAITINFDRAIDPVSITSASFWAFGRASGPVSGAFSFAPTGDAATLTPEHPFSAGEVVMVILSEAITALDGTNLAPGGYSFQFWVVAVAADLQFTEVDTIFEAGTEGIAADWDRDGHTDLAFGSSELRVFLNDGASLGGFSFFAGPATPFVSSASPAAVADFDRDGNLDLVVADAFSDTLIVRAGNGDATFQVQPGIPVGAIPRSVAVLDVDGDGDLDLVNSNAGASTLSVAANDGTGAFAAATFFGPGLIAAWDIAVADMDEDGRLDLVVGALGQGEIVVLTSDGSGNFTLTDTVSGVYGTVMLAVGDLNGDGHIDVTSANSFAENGAVLLGNGDGTLGPPTFVATGPDTRATDLGDLDGDGDLDWILTRVSGPWALWINDGLGNFSLGQVITPLLHPHFPITSGWGATILDADTDGELDLAMIPLGFPTIILRNGPQAPQSDFIRGDANDDGAVNIADCIFILALLFPVSSAPPLVAGPCFEAHDANDDGLMNIADAVFLLAVLFSSPMQPSPVPPPPFPDCGQESVPDLIPCVSSSCP